MKSKQTHLKCLVFLASFFFALQAYAQKYETYYDHKWNACEPSKARFFSVLEKTDSGWFRQDYFVGNTLLQMRALYEDSACKIRNGNFIFYHANGYVSQMGTMYHNKREGVCMSFYSDGSMQDSGTYKNGNYVGHKLSWHRNGYASDSVTHRNDSVEVEVTWFDDGTPATAGTWLQGKKNGKWKYFHKNGLSSMTELYEGGNLRSREKFNESGALMADTANPEIAATFKGGIKAWVQYLERQLYWPSGFKIVNGDMAAVVVSFVLNEDGKVEHAEVITPFAPEFDKIALQVVKNSPAWKPAIQNNHRVKYRYSQVVTFMGPG